MTSQIVYTVGVKQRCTALAHTVILPNEMGSLAREFQLQLYHLTFNILNTDYTGPSIHTLALFLPLSGTFLSVELLNFRNVA